MHIVFFSYPDFFGSQSRSVLSSMPRFLRMLTEGMTERGHTIEVWSPTSRFFNIPLRGSFKKWLGYIDQHLIFPVEVQRRLKRCSPDTLFVFADHAQGMWVPLVASRHHVIHCHDFLAQYSALGKIAQNPTGWSGRQYQRLINRGYSQGRNFICTSVQTQADLYTLLPQALSHSQVVYNSISKVFTATEPIKARRDLSSSLGLDLAAGYLLNVGNNQWYKNRIGVIELYDAWRHSTDSTLPLLLVGEAPDSNLAARITASPFAASIHSVSNIPDALVRLAYAGAEVFIFPSLAEGFGWPIAEAMACGCPVITTAEAPMTEVAGDAGFLIPRRPDQPLAADAWALHGAQIIKQVLVLGPEERQKTIKMSLLNARRFDMEATLNRIEYIYQDIIQTP